MHLLLRVPVPWLLGQALFAHHFLAKCHAHRYHWLGDRGQLQRKRSCRVKSYLVHSRATSWIQRKGLLLPLQRRKDTYQGWRFTASRRCQRAGSDRFLWQLRASVWLGLHVAFWGAVVDFIFFHGDFFTVAETPQRTQVFMFTPLSTATTGHTEQVRIILWSFQSHWKQKWFSVGKIKLKLFKCLYADWQASALSDHVTRWLALRLGCFGTYRTAHLAQQVERQAFRSLPTSMGKWYAFSFLDITHLRANIQPEPRISHQGQTAVWGMKCISTPVLLRPSFLHHRQILLLITHPIVLKSSSGGT